jgi:hypothetical protein
MTLPRALNIAIHVTIVQTRMHDGAEMGKQKNTIRMMMKPFANDRSVQHLSLVEQDQLDLPNML